MNLQQAAKSRTSANGFSRRRVEKEMGARIDNKFQPGKSTPSRVTGLYSSNRCGSYGSPSRDRFIHSITCLIGHHVEVQVKDGSVFSGIFHTFNADKDFDIVLKMAHLSKDVSSRGQKGAFDIVHKTSSTSKRIPARELLQIIAKDIPVLEEGLSEELESENQELLLDSYISNSGHREEGRQLERWVPDEDCPQSTELENIFDKPWTRSWDQFEVNETLFGVKSTFDEDLYTTKLEKGPRMRELEEQAMRIAREIEGEYTHDLHLAEERGIYPHGNIDIDEETKYSSVYRGVDDSGHAEEDVMMDTRNDDTFGTSSEFASARSFADATAGKKYDEDQALSSTSLVGDLRSQLTINTDLFHSGSLASKHISGSDHAVEHDVSIQENYDGEEGGNNYAREWVRTQVLDEKPQTTTTNDIQSSLNTNRDNSAKGAPTFEAIAYVPSDGTVKGEDNTSSACELADGVESGKVHGALQFRSSHGQPRSSALSTSEGGVATSVLSNPALSRSSSLGSWSSEKSTLNPNAKEFKLNPNAKSFVPSQTPLRPSSPVAADNSYFPPNMPAVPPMHSMPLGMGIGPSFPGPQPMLFNPQAAPMQPQGYFPSHGPQYGQQMIIGHPRQVMYMPSYPPEMPYNGRDY